VRKGEGFSIKVGILRRCQGGGNSKLKRNGIYVCCDEVDGVRKGLIPDVC